MRLDQAGYPPLGRAGRLRAGRFLLAGAAGLAVLLAAGCSAGGSKQVAARVVIAAVPGVDNAPLFLARKDGLFAQNGLANVTIRSYPTQSAVFAALRDGTAQIAASDYGDIFYHQAQSPDYRILADGYDAAAGVLEVLTMPSSSITSPARLANVTVGVPDDETLPVSGGVPDSLDAAAGEAVLFSYLNNGDASVRWDPMPPAQEISELRSGRLQAVLLPQPYIYQAQSQYGAVELMDVCSGATADLPLSGYIATDGWVRENGAAVADFQRAIGAAQSSAAMTGPIRQVLPSATGMTLADADMATVGTYPTSTSYNQLERVVTLLNNDNVISVGSAARWSGSLGAMIVPAPASGS